MEHIRDFCEDAARSGIDGQFAIACALFDLADAQQDTAKALLALGLKDASTPFGAIELLAEEVKKIGEHIFDISSIARLQYEASRDE